MRILLVLSLVCVAVGADALVGPHCDFAQATITGAEAFGADRLRSTLQKDYVVRRHARTLALLEPFLATVDRRLTVGYHANGHPDVTVEVRSLARQLHIRVVEGPGYRWTEPQIAPGPLPRELVWSLLLHPRDQQSGAPVTPAQAEQGEVTEPVIALGAWADFTPGFLERSRNLLLRQAVQHGAADVEVDLRMARLESGLARLDVAIRSSAGPRPLEAIHCPGLERGSRPALEALLNAAGIAVGAVPTPAAVVAARQALLECGCFIDPRVELEPGSAGPVAVVTVLESDVLPTLGAELMPAQQALSSVAPWFRERIRSGQEALCISLHEGGASVITRFETNIVANRRFFLDVTIRGAPSAPERRFGMHVAGGRLAVHLDDQVWSMDWDPASSHRPSIALGFVVKSPTADAPTKIGSMRFNASVLPTHAHQGPAPLLLTDLRLDAAALYYDTRIPEDWVLTETDGLVHGTSVRGTSGFLRHFALDSGTGHPRELGLDLDSGADFRLKAMPLAEAPPFPGMAKPLAEEATVVARLAVRSLLDFFRDRVQTLPDTEQASATLSIERIAAVSEIALAVVPRLGAMWSQSAPEGDSFWIPTDPTARPETGEMVAILLGAMLTGAEEIWPSDAWPRLLLQEAHGFLSGAGNNLGAGISVIVTDRARCGPLGCWLAAEFSELIDARRAVEHLAALALERLDGAGLASDVAILGAHPEVMRSLLAEVPIEPLLSLVDEAQRADVAALLAGARDGQDVGPTFYATLLASGMLDPLRDRLHMLRDAAEPPAQPIP